MDSKGFLAAEQRAQELVDALEQLTGEIDSYKSAEGRLESVRANLEDMVIETGKLVSASRDVITVVRTIGGPQIDSRLETLSSSLDTSVAALREQTGELQTKADDIRGRISEIGDTVAATLQQRLVEMEEHIASTHDQIAQIADTLGSHARDLERTERHIRKTQSLGYLTIALSATAVVIGALVLNSIR